MISLHCRGCDCELCMPGFPAQGTRVYRTRPRKLGYGEALAFKQRRAGKVAGQLMKARAK